MARDESAVEKRSLHMFNPVRFDDVADLDVVVAGDFHAAVVAFANFAHVLLEALERIERGDSFGRREDHGPLADDANLRRTLDGALRDVTAGDSAATADFENLADGRPAEVDDLFAR